MGDITKTKMLCLVISFQYLKVNRGVFLVVEVSFPSAKNDKLQFDYKNMFAIFTRAMRRFVASSEYFAPSRLEEISESFLRQQSSPGENFQAYGTESPPPPKSRIWSELMSAKGVTFHYQSIVAGFFSQCGHARSPHSQRVPQGLALPLASSTGGQGQNRPLCAA